ncbi:uncharacterized protein LOC129589828 isoform X2 [Paramacrobiotus metropolitanus]|uniref:uncharacterized protein LOC129589828 isoform X2 n=1 Tax=Paramacrobiotus metropolitanus TaxID=2943436 RepID=UPI002445E432|nr:uncharacterized protein LOC129589828 isoform X2 [Paramacrobiotus metropolitanus]
MQNPRNFPEDAGSLLALSIVHVLLAVVGFTANLYNFFYGLLFSAHIFPVMQTLAFVFFTIPLYGMQLLWGVGSVVACVRVFGGNRNLIFFGEDREISDCMCRTSFVYLLLMVIVWFFAVASSAQPFVASLGMWGSVHHVFQTDLTGHLVMLGMILALIAGMVVEEFAIQRSVSVSNDLICINNNHKLLARVEEQTGSPPPETV